MSLKEIGVSLVKNLYGSLDELPRLVIKLLLRRAKNFFEKRNKLGCKLLHRRLVVFIYF